MSAYVITSEKEAFGREMFDGILMWIEGNLEIDQIWGDEDIVEFVMNTPDVYRLLLKFIAESELPGDVFSEEELGKWADSQHGVHT